MAKYKGSVIVRGVTCGSLQEAATLIPRERNQITGYIRAHECTMQEAVDYFVKRADDLTFEGKVWNSAKEYITSRGWSYEAVNSIRRHKGLSWKESIERHLNPGTSTLSFWLKERNIKTSRFYRVRKSRGLSVEEAQKLYETNPELFKVRTMVRKSDVANQFDYVSSTSQDNIPVHAIRCRTCGRLLSVTREEYATFQHSDEFCIAHEREPIVSRPVGEKLYTVGNKTKLTFWCAIIAAHTSEKTYQEKLAEVGEPQLAFDALYEDWLKKDKGPWVVNGVKCKTKTAVAKQLGRSVGGLMSYVGYHNITVQEAIDRYLSGDTLYAIGNLPDVAGIATASSGLLYVVCSKCRRCYILTNKDAAGFSHDGCSGRRAIPGGWSLPRHLYNNIRTRTAERKDTK